MNSTERHIDQLFAEVVSEAKMSVPAHLKGTIFSQLAKEGFSKPESAISNSSKSVSGTTTFPLKTIIYSCIATAVTGFVIGWQVSYHFYNKDSEAIFVNPLPIEQPTTTELEQPTFPEKDKSKAATSGIPTKTTASHPSAVNKNISTTSPESPKTLTIEANSVNQPAELIISESEGETQQTNSSATTDSIKETTSSKTLLEQLKNKEQRFNNKLFKE